MGISTDILNELTGLSPMVAAISKVNPFTVPNGYFDTLSNNISVRLAKEENSSISEGEVVLSPALASIRKVNPFMVPNGYFDTLSDNILAVAFQQEHASVPEGYFNHLANNILNRIKAEETGDASKELRALSPLLYSIQSDDKLFEVPKNYFKNLPDEMLQRISKETSAEEISYLSPLLAGIQQRNVFKVPQGYFDGFFSEIQNELQPQTKIISFNRRRSTFMKYAVAAAFTGVMALTVFKFTGTGNAGNKMPAYAKDGLALAMTTPANVDAAIGNLSNDEIASYLQDNGQNIDSKILATTVLDEKNLPSEADYLSDEKALDNLFNNVTPEDLKN